MSHKPYAAAAEQNRQDILSVIEKEFSQANSVLEIGSGTGQHAIYFARHLTHLTWQSSDKTDMLEGINQWLDEAGLNNTPEAIALDVTKQWPQEKYEAAFGANIAHIMHSHEIEAMFTGLSHALKPNAKFCLYGPFNMNGRYTSDSNRNFDAWLQSRDAESSIRDKSYMDKLARLNQLQPVHCYPMPSNNFILCWQKN